MPSREAMEKLRAVLDYVPEEAAQRLDGDPQEYYDALTRRLHRTVAVKSMVKRRVIVAQPDPGEATEPEAPTWTPPPEPEPEPAPAPFLTPAAVEASSVVEAPEPRGRDEPAEGDASDFFDVTGKAKQMNPVEPEVSLSESEWSRLESEPEETAEGPVSAEEQAEDEAFEEIEIPQESPTPELPEEPHVGAQLGTPGKGGRARGAVVPGETAVAEGELAPTAEFEVEEAGETTAAEEFEILEEEEGEFEEGQEPPYQVNEFTLFRRDARTRGGRAKSAFFFSAEPAVEGATPSPLPEGYEVIVHETTGIPVIRKSTARIIPVIEIEGLGPVMAERLERAGVRTTKDLLRIDPRKVSEDTGISERLLGNFRAMADLLQMPGIYPDQAAALVYAGCRSLPDLKNANPTDLAKQVNTAAKDHQLKLRGKMTSSRIRSWQQKLAKLTPE